MGLFLLGAFLGAAITFVIVQYRAKK